MVKTFLLDDHIVKKIKSCDPQKCWNLIREDVGKKLFGDGFIVVPHLDEASRFELNAVILEKRRNVLDWMLRRSQELVAVNMLQEMIRSDISSLEGIKLTRPERVNKRLPKDTIVFGNVGNKTAAVRIIGLSMYQISDLPNDGDIMIDITPFCNFHTRNLFLISKVIYAEEFRVRVLKGNTLDEFKVMRKIPLAFQLTQFNVMYSAILGCHQAVLKEPKVRWQRHAKVIIPRTLLIDRENRGGGDDGKRINGPRNIRHNTILRETSDSDEEDDE